MGKGRFRMSSSQERYDFPSHNGVWIKENAVSLSHDLDTRVPAAFTQEYQILVEMCASMSSGFMLLNASERVTYANPSALRLLRLQNCDAQWLKQFDIRQHFFSLAADSRQVRTELDQFWLQPEQEYYTDLALAGAAAFWLRVRFFPVRHHNGHLLGRGLLLEDITLEHYAAESRAETLARAAHELKMPLAIIKGCATTLLGGCARWDLNMQREMLHMIDAQSDRLYDVLSTLLDVWRFDAGTQLLRLVQIQLSELLLQTLKRWQKQVPDHQFILDLSPDLPPVICDALRIEQVLNHLLHNAITYSAQDRLIRIQLEVNEAEVCVRITDNGIGIAAENLERIFDRFYRVQDEQPVGQLSLAPSSTGGSGLGLAAARATIEAHGGKIWADSLGLGQGATFSFTLPFVLPNMAVADTASAVTLDEQSSSVQLRTTRASFLKQDLRQRILLAENDPRFARYIRANLEEQHYRVQIVNQGVQFLRQLDLEEPDLIILSERLADTQSIELLQRLREFATIPVIVLCDHADEEMHVQLFDLGCDDLVMKPFGMKELLARIRALLRRQSSSAEQNQTVFVTGDLMIDYAQHLVTVKNTPVQLSRTEYKLLSTLAQNVGMVVTHELLLARVWGPGYNHDIDFIWVYISRLRRKVEPNPRLPKYILTVPDVGYKLAKI
jgi:DNA-binding response OmpR family regulator/signal transduction histidine kinase